MRSIPRWAWLLGGGAVAIAAAQRLTRREGFNLQNLDGRDIDALARMLIVEHPSGSDAERAQIVLVAVNRARKYNAPPENVVAPGTRRPVQDVQGGTWNGSDNYRRKYDAAGSDSRFAAARAFVIQVLRGQYPNYGYTAFIHPSGMPTPPCASNRVQMDTFAGPRCMPEWGSKPTDRVGIAYFYA